MTVGLAWAAAVGGAALVLLGAVPRLQLLHPVPAMAAALIPYGILAWSFVTAVLLTSRSWRVRAVALVTLALLAVQVGWARPYWPRGGADSPSAASFTVMTLNTYYGWADADQLVAAAEEVRPDVVVLSEVTRGGWEALRATAWAERFPHHVGEPGEAWASDGMMVFSPWPLEVLETPPTSDDTYVVRVLTPTGPLTAFGVHVANPWTGFASWEPDLAAVREVSGRYRDENLVVLGDFNATREHPPLREILAAGLADAAEQAGRGWRPTFPSGWVGVPPAIGIDHVLAGPGLRAEAVWTFHVDGTDHRGLVAELTLDDGDR